MRIFWKYICRDCEATFLVVRVPLVDPYSMVCPCCTNQAGVEYLGEVKLKA